MGCKEIRLPALLADGCVLQQGEKAKIWGWCEPGCEVTLQFQGETWKTQADENGRFSTRTGMLSAGGPFALEICASNGAKVSLLEVYVGEVFVCAGQSNMELPMNRVRVRYPEEFAAGGCAGVHMYKVKECAEFREVLEDHREAGWSTCTKEALGEASALGYFFGKMLHESKNVPVGILNVSLGGTPVEAWTSKEGLSEYPNLLKIREQYQSREFCEKTEEDQNRVEQAWYAALEEKEKESADAPWQKLLVPGVFAEQGLENFSGLLWLKKKFWLEKEMAGKKALLRFGTMVDSDKTYINGVKVGETEYQYPPRRYEIPADLLKEGENEITIRLVCNDGRGRVTYGKDYDILTEDGKSCSLEGEWEYQIRAVQESIPEHTFISRKPTGMFQGMVAPCLPYTVKGVVWYQGESNDANPNEYETLLKGMIADWRSHWEQEKLPFILIQLPNCGIDIAPGEAWPLIRAAQERVADLPDVAMTVNIDIGEDNDLHPLNKKDAAYRAFLAAEKLIYKKDIVAEGPKLIDIKKQEEQIILYFDTGDGEVLCVTDGAEIKAFEVQGADEAFYPVKAFLEGNRVALDCTKVPKAKRVRYAWKKAPGKSLLCSQLGLAAAPFDVKL